MSDFFAATEYEPLELTGEEIRRLRRTAGLTQTELAEKLKVSMDSVRNWEKNRTHPLDTKNVIALVEILKPKPRRAGETRILPPDKVALNRDKTLAVVNRRGDPPVVYFTKTFPIIPIL